MYSPNSPSYGQTAAQIIAEANRVRGNRVFLTALAEINTLPEAEWLLVANAGLDAVPEEKMRNTISDNGALLNPNNRATECEFCKAGWPLENGIHTLSDEIGYSTERCELLPNNEASK